MNIKAIVISYTISKKLIVLLRFKMFIYVENHGIFIAYEVFFASGNQFVNIYFEFLPLHSRHMENMSNSFNISSMSGLEVMFSLYSNIFSLFFSPAIPGGDGLADSTDDHQRRDQCDKT